MARKQILLIIGCIILLASSAFAEEKGIYFGGHGGIHFGGLYWELSELNDFLDPAGVENIPEILPILGGGGQGIIFGGIVVGARGSQVTRHLSGRDMSVDVGISYGFADFGYAIVNTRRWLVIPVGGIGGSTVQLQMDGNLTSVGLAKYAENYNSNRPTDPVDDKINMTTSSALGHVGMMVYHQVPFAESDGGGFGAFLVGLSAGWMFEVSSASWEIEGENVKNAPSYSPHGVYLQLELHFGGGTSQAQKTPEIKRSREKIYLVPESLAPEDEQPRLIVVPMDPMHFDDDPDENQEEDPQPDQEPENNR